MQRPIGINILDKTLRMNNVIPSKTLSKNNNIKYKVITIAFRHFQDKFLYIGFSDNKSIKDYYHKFITNPTNNKSFSSLKAYHKSKTYIRSRSKTRKLIHDRVNRGDKNDNGISRKTRRKNQK